MFSGGQSMDWSLSRLDMLQQVRLFEVRVWFSGLCCNLVVFSPSAPH